ncbi:MAG: ankyrin repeat domain-containing protein [Leptospiraceae bacterium]|nr:ankyrin repeat domain-containing protein [Leptospiraceae bacterium]
MINDKSGKTALMFAARRGHKQALSVLLDFDADVDIEDNDHFTAITWSERFGQAEIADYLRRLSDK